MADRPPTIFAETPKQARSLMDELFKEAYKPGKITGVDTEFVPISNEPVLMSYSWGKGIRRVVRAELVKEFFGDWLVDDQTKLAYQNYKADVETFEYLGISHKELVASFYIDVMVAGVLRDETLVKHGLKAQMFHWLRWYRREYGQTFVYVPVGKKKAIVMDPRQVMDNLPPDALLNAVLKWGGAKGIHKTGPRDADAWKWAMLDYAGVDAEGTQRLAVDHRSYLKKTGYWDSYVSVDLPFTTTLMQCQASGAFIDQPTLRKILRKQEIRILRAEHCFRAAAGNPKLNLRSGPQMKKLLFGEWEWPAHPTNKSEKTGEPSMDKEVLQWWLKKHKLEMAEVKLAFNNASTMKGTFLEGILLGMSDDGRLRSDLNQIGGKTSGRISSRKFDVLVETHRTLKNGDVKTIISKEKAGANVQNIPARHEKDPDGIRRAFRAPRIGETTAWGEPATEKHKLIVCVVPETRVLKADMTWVAAGDIMPGDKLVGFDEDLAVKTKLNSHGKPYKIRAGQGAKLRESIVQSVRLLKKDCFRVVTDRGTVTSSDEHMWVAKKRSSRYSNLREWIRTDDLEPGDEITFLCSPWDVDTSYSGGYLAGVFDGEGWVHRGSVCFGQNKGPTLDMVKTLLTHCGFDYVERPQNKKRPKMRQLELRGNRAAMRFLGSIRPKRLLNTYMKDRWQGTSTWGNGMSVARVLKVERVHDAAGGHSRDVVAIKTSTKTFIAEGMLSHNCDYSGFHLVLVANFIAKLPGKPKSAMVDVMKKYGTPSAVHVYTTIQMFKHAEAHRCDSSSPWCKVVDKKTNKITADWKKFHAPGKSYSLKEFTMDDWGMVKPIFPDQYTYSKNTNFALIFLGSPWTLAYNTGRDPEDEDQLNECKRHFDDWYELYPEIPEYQNFMIDHGYEHGWVPKIGGGRGHVRKMLEGCDKNGNYIHDEEKRKKMRKHGERVCTNTPAQGSEAAIVKMAMNLIRMDKEMIELRSAPLFPVHDEVVCEAPERTSALALERQVYLMKQPYKDELEIALAVEGAIGDDWISAKP